MHLDFWADLGIVCGALLALGGVVVGGTHIMRNIWRRARREEDLRLMLMGDPDHKPPIPSISTRIDTLTATVAQLVTENALLRETLEEHIRWHGVPGGRPAGGPTPTVNGPRRRGRGMT
jgi:hypothetical protein